MTSAFAKQILQGIAGPAGAVDNAVARFDGVTGKKIQSSNVTIDDAGNIVIGSIIAGIADYDKFIVSDGGQLKYRTGAEVLSDIGAAAAAHFHDGDTLQLDGINSDGGAFAFNTTGDISFNQNFLLANGKSIGIGPAAERLEFYTAGYAAFMGCKLGVGIASPSYALDVNEEIRIGNAASAVRGILEARNRVGIPTINFRAPDNSDYISFVAAGFFSQYQAGLGNGGGFLNVAFSAYRLLVNRGDTGTTVMGSGGQYGWTSTTGFTNTATNDTGLKRNSAAVVKATNGAVGWGDFLARNIGFGTATFGASMVNGLAMLNGTIPTGNVADQFSFYARDFVAGNSCPYFRTENGTIIGLNQGLLTTDSPSFAGFPKIGGATDYLTVLSDGELYFTGTAGLPYGSCSMYHGNWAQALAQNTWYNVSDADFISGLLNSVTHDGSGKLTVARAGIYKVSVSLDFEVDAANKHIEIGFEVSGSGSAATEGIVCQEAIGANQEFMGTTVALLDLAASATIELCVRTIDAGNPTITIDCVSLDCIHIGGT